MAETIYTPARLRKVKHPERFARRLLAQLTVTQHRPDDTWRYIGRVRCLLEACRGEIVATFDPQYQWPLLLRSCAVAQVILRDGKLIADCYDVERHEWDYLDMEDYDAIRPDKGKWERFLDAEEREALRNPLEGRAFAILSA